MKRKREKREKETQRFLRILLRYKRSTREEIIGEEGVK